MTDAAQKPDDKPKLTGRGGPGRGQGRKPGVKFPIVKVLARDMTEPAMRELFRIAGLLMTEKKNDKDGSIVLDADGKPIMVPVPGSPSDNARISAINIILERGWGKAMQPIVGVDDETGEAGGPVQVTAVELELVPTGTPMNDDEPVDDEEASDERVA